MTPSQLVYQCILQRSMADAELETNTCQIIRVQVELAVIVSITPLTLRVRYLADIQMSGGARSGRSSKMALGTLRIFGNKSRVSITAYLDFSLAAADLAYVAQYRWQAGAILLMSLTAGDSSSTLN